MTARLLGAAPALLALGHMSTNAAGDDAVRPEDRAAVAACLKIAAAAPQNDVASPTNDKTDPAAKLGLNRPSTRRRERLATNTLASKSLRSRAFHRNRYSAG
jgi:hypothetical protein